MIESGICWNFKKDILLGVHDFETDDFAIALYTKSAKLSPASTTAYTDVGEVEDLDYDAGGMIMTHRIVEENGTVKVVFDDVEFDGEITARGALVYNYTQGNKAVAILNFGMDQSSSNGVFKIRFPKFHDYGNLIAIK